jgi:DNA-binding GntR family transcriptional regulator
MPEEWSSRPGRSIGARSDAIYDTLRARITSGELKPGDVITELALAAEFQVSRTPIREAIKFLVWEGLLERRGRDMRVRMLDPEEIADIYSVRTALEQLAARLAAGRRTDFDLAHLRHRLEQMQKLGTKDVESRPAASYEFHFALWRSAHNNALTEALERLQAVVVEMHTTTLHYPKRWAELVSQCAGILEAVADGDPERAAAIVEEQMSQARDARLAIYTA